jgi:hypothetical protein
MLAHPFGGQLRDGVASLIGIPNSGADLCSPVTAVDAQRFGYAQPDSERRLAILSLGGA